MLSSGKNHEWINYTVSMMMYTIIEPSPAKGPTESRSFIRMRIECPGIS